MQALVKFEYSSLIGQGSNHWSLMLVTSHRRSALRTSQTQKMRVSYLVTLKNMKIQLQLHKKFDPIVQCTSNVSFFVIICRHCNVTKKLHFHILHFNRMSRQIADGVRETRNSIKDWSDRLRFVSSIGNIEKAMSVFNCLGGPWHLRQYLTFLQFF